jgi:hypothetical protein
MTSEEVNELKWYFQCEVELFAELAKLHFAWGDETVKYLDGYIEQKRLMFSADRGNN